MADFWILETLLLTLLVQESFDPMVTNQLYDEYDFIVVGSGPAGSVVASRLSEIPGVTVLLLEAGDTDWGNNYVRTPHKFVNAIFSPANWNYTLSQQGRIMYMNQGKTLGGGSSINAMFYIRGSPHDFDSWEDHGAKGWGWKDVESFFKKLENAVDDDISHKAGRGGRLNFSLNYRTRLSNKLIQASKEIGVKEVDYFDELDGLSRIVATVHNGVRQSSSEAFLRSVYAKRKDRLHILTSALVEKVLFEFDGSGKITANGVSYIKNGKVETVKARKEVILSAGVIETPHILMLSGIGPKDHLQDMDIVVKVDLPGVGSSMSHHLMTPAAFEINSPKYYGKSATSLEEYIVNGTGFYSCDGADVIHHHKTKYFGTNISLSTKERPFPTIQTVVTPVPRLYFYPTTKRPDFHVDVMLSLQHPKSRGTVRLQSTNPLDQPIIDPNIFSNKDDLTMMTEGFRQVEEFEMTKSMKTTGFAMITPTICNGTMQSDPPRSSDFYECFSRALARPIHSCCTAKMGASDDKMAVVDERLRVHGVRGLRVADASVMPHVTSSNTQAPCYMIGEKASHMIKEDWNLI